MAILSVQINVTSRWWPAAVLVILLPALILLLMLIPAEERQLGNGGILLFALATLLPLGGIVAGAYLYRGSDSFTANESGLHLRSRRHGNRQLAWTDLVELGWVAPTRYTRGGLAGRTRDGGPYEPGGPSIAGWLCQPTGPVQAPQGLQELCEQQSVAWRDYAPAEVM